MPVGAAPRGTTGNGIPHVAAYAATFSARIAMLQGTTRVVIALPRLTIGVDLSNRTDAQGRLRQKGLRARQRRLGDAFWKMESQYARHQELRREGLRHAVGRSPVVVAVTYRRTGRCRAASESPRPGRNAAIRSFAPAPAHTGRRHAVRPKIMRTPCCRRELVPGDRRAGCGTPLGQVDEAAVR